MIIFVNGYPKIYDKSDFKSDKDYYKTIMSNFIVQKPKFEKESWNIQFYKTKINCND